jgi:hypothetical protein
VSDPLAAAKEAKQIEAALREARSLLRRADKLQASVLALNDALSSRLVDELAKTANELVDALTHLRLDRQRRAKRNIRRLRG